MVQSLAHFVYNRRDDPEVLKAVGIVLTRERDGPRVQIVKIEHQGPDSNLKINDLLALSEEEDLIEITVE